MRDLPADLRGFAATFDPIDGDPVICALEAAATEIERLTALVENRAVESVELVGLIARLTAERAEIDQLQAQVAAGVQVIIHERDALRTALSAIASQRTANPAEFAFKTLHPVPNEQITLVDKCADCGYPKSEHHHDGACYGLCGEFRQG